MTQPTYTITLTQSQLNFLTTTLLAHTHAINSDDTYDTQPYQSTFNLLASSTPD